MASLGLPVPPGFTITTEVCTFFYAQRQNLSRRSQGAGRAAVAEVGRRPARIRPLRPIRCCVSVRSGARASMPGMMDTVLNLGLNDARCRNAGEDLGRRALRLRQSIAVSSRCIPTWCSTLTPTISRTSSKDCKDSNGYALDTDLSVADWREVIADYKAKVEEATGKPFPQEPRDQLWGAIGAVFSSWMNQRAITYRRLTIFPQSWGTAVNVQAMVFGNMGETSATGVAFTRNPSTGANELYGEFLVNAQGEDVVAGIRTPQNITEAARKAAHSDRPSLESLMPDVFNAIRRHDQIARETLSRHAGPRVHGRARQIVDAADPQRQAHRAGRVAGRGGNGQGRSDLARTRGHAGRAERARSASAPDPRSRRPSRRLWRPACPRRPARRAAKSSFRQTKLKRCVSRAESRSWSGSKPRPEDIHGMHAARRDRDDTRRHDFPCRGRGARHGQALRFRRRRDPHRLCAHRR